MIKGGNYRLLDYAGITPNLVDAFTEYYGEKHRETIQKRLDKVVYIPFYSYSYVYAYCMMKLDQYKDEIIAEYMKNSGRESLTDAQKDIVWYDSGSFFFGSILDGNHLEENTFLTKEIRDEVLLNRGLIAEQFGFDKDNFVELVKAECKHLRKAIMTVMDNHPCEVFSDVNKVMTNKNNALQTFLNHTSRFYMELSDRDVELIAKPDFTPYDYEDMDCKYLVCGNDIESPGLIQYFTPDNEYKFKHGTPEERLTVLKGRVRLYMINTGKENLKYVTEDEIFGKVSIDNPAEFYQRLQKEAEHLIAINPINIISPETAQAVEEHRKLLCYSLHTGTKFMKNLNKRWNGDIRIYDDETLYSTTMEYLNHQLDSPVNFMFIDQAELMTIPELDNALIHESNHAVSNGRGILSRDGKTVYCRYGIHGDRGVIDSDGRVRLAKGDTRHNYSADGLLLLEEDLNERQSKEIQEIYWSKFGNIFTPSDITVIDEPTETICLYDYFNFMTEGFWQKYKDAIKEFRVTDGGTIYYDVDGEIPPNTLPETMQSSLKYIVDKHTHPEKVQARGVIPFKYAKALGDLLVDFSNTYREKLYALKINPKDLRPDNFENLQGLDIREIADLYMYYHRSQEIMQAIEREEQSIARAENRKKKIIGVINSGKQTTRKIKNNILSRLPKRVSSTSTLDSSEIQEEPSEETMQNN